MNAEYALNNVADILETYLANEIVTVETEASATYSAPSPAQFIYGPYVESLIENFPAWIILGDNSSNKINSQGYQVRTFRYDCVIWAVADDLEKVHRYILRYADATVRILRNENYLWNYLCNPLAETARYSDAFESEVGLAQGALVQGSIEIIIA
jgi:hypothetical protein